MSKSERFLIIDPLSLNNDVYFTSDGNTTKDEKEALIVNSMEEGDIITKDFTLYQPGFKSV